MAFVVPRTYFIGASVMRRDALESYLRDTGQLTFLDSVEQARRAGLNEAEVLCSFYAKLCYKSLVLGKNANVTRTRDIADNLLACFKQGHSSVFGHCNLNFVTADCSRVLTHELVRNHVGTEFSQTSGRYVRGDRIDLVFDPILKPVEVLGSQLLKLTESVYQSMCDRMGLNGREGVARFLTREVVIDHQVQRLPPTPEQLAEFLAENFPNRDVDNLPFDYKKKVTSALRRFLPNGQSNEIGWSINLRALRHVIQVRTSRHAEREIRLVFNQVYNLVKAEYPMIFADAKVREVEGLSEIYNMKTQPYMLTEEEHLAALSADELRAELARRGEAAHGQG